MYEDGQAAREALIVAQKIEMSAARDPLTRAQDTESRDQETEARDPTPDDTFNNSKLPYLRLGSYVLFTIPISRNTHPTRG